MSNAIFEKINELNENKILRVNIGRCSKGTSNTPNWHEALEILLCISGSGTVLLDDRKYTFEKGNVIIVNSQVIHSVYANENLEFIFVQLDRDFCLKQLIDLQQIRFFEYIENDEKLIGYIENVSNTVKQETYLSKAKNNCAALELLIYLCEEYKQSSLYTPSSDAVSFNRVKKAMLFIKQNYEKELTLENIALEVGINKYQLTREFKAVTGESVFEFLNSVRCKEASRLLKQGASVTQAAYSCGFSNLSYFSRTYKKYIGELPSVKKQKYTSV